MLTTLPNTHALLIGIAAYQHINPLPPAVINDVRSVHDVLIDPALCAYPPENVTLLLDGQATKAAIRQGLANLAAATNSESTVLIYLSSHGGQLTDGPHSGAYLLPVDARYTSAEALAASSIAGDDFAAALAEIPARKLLVILDCCHAAGIGALKDVDGVEVKDGLPAVYYEQLAGGRGRAILASADQDEKSYILGGATNSLFTQHLLAGLRGGIASEDGLIRVFDLFEYIQPRVTGDYPLQHPIFKAELHENFPVALRLAGQPKAPVRDDEGFVYDAYLSFVDQEPDAAWVWTTLVPTLETAGLRIAISGVVQEPGVARVVETERAIRQSKRTVMVISPQYMADNLADFDNVLAQTMGIQEGSYRLLPIIIEAVDQNSLPTRISMLNMLDLTHPYRGKLALEQLTAALQKPLPRRA